MTGALKLRQLIRYEGQHMQRPNPQLRSKSLEGVGQIGVGPTDSVRLLAIATADTQKRLDKCNTKGSSNKKLILRLSLRIKTLVFLKERIKNNQNIEVSLGGWGQACEHKVSSNLGVSQYQYIVIKNNTTGEKEINYLKASSLSYLNQEVYPNYQDRDVDTIMREINKELYCDHVVNKKEDSLKEILEEHMQRVSGNKRKISLVESKTKSDFFNMLLKTIALTKLSTLLNATDKSMLKGRIHEEEVKVFIDQHEERLKKELSSVCKKLYLGGEKYHRANSILKAGLGIPRDAADLDVAGGALKGILSILLFPVLLRYTWGRSTDGDIHQKVLRYTDGMRTALSMPTGFAAGVGMAGGIDALFKGENIADGVTSAADAVSFGTDFAGLAYCLAIPLGIAGTFKDSYEFGKAIKTYLQENQTIEDVRKSVVAHLQEVRNVDDLDEKASEEISALLKVRQLSKLTQVEQRRRMVAYGLKAVGTGVVTGLVIAAGSAALASLGPPGWIALSAVILGTIIRLIVTRNQRKQNRLQRRLWAAEVGVNMSLPKQKWLYADANLKRIDNGSKDQKSLSQLKETRVRTSEWRLVKHRNLNKKIKHLISKKVAFETMKKVAEKQFEKEQRKPLKTVWCRSIKESSQASEKLVGDMKKGLVGIYKALDRQQIARIDKNTFKLMSNKLDKTKDGFQPFGGGEATDLMMKPKIKKAHSQALYFWLKEKGVVKKHQVVKLPKRHQIEIKLRSILGRSVSARHLAEYVDDTMTILTVLNKKYDRINGKFERILGVMGLKKSDVKTLGKIQTNYGKFSRFKRWIKRKKVTPDKTFSQGSNTNVNNMSALVTPKLVTCIQSYLKGEECASYFETHIQPKLKDIGFFSNLNKTERIIFMRHICSEPMSQLLDGVNSTVL